MSPTRLIVDADSIRLGEVLIAPAAARHARVARVAPDEDLELLDLAGVVGRARLLGWEGAACRVEVTDVEHERGEPPAPLTLALGVLHTSAFEWAVEKATELGATVIAPVLAERVQGRDHQKRVERWQRVADAAVAQCGRSRAPCVEAPRPLADLLAGSTGTRLLAQPGAGRPSTIAADRSITVLVGPEGGLTDAETRSALDAGFLPLPLGPRTLRAETAAAAALAVAQRQAAWPGW